MPKFSTDPKPTLPDFDPHYPRQHRVPFPLFCHASGRWCKKHDGKFLYFGYWRGDHAVTQGDAVKAYHDWKDGGKATGTSIDDLCHGFLTAKKQAYDAGELSPRTFRDYQRCARDLVKHFGKHRDAAALRPADFAGYRAVLAARYSPDPLGREVQMVRTLFKWAFDSESLAAMPRFGPDFKRPSKKAIRKNRQVRPAKMFTAAEIRRLIDAARSLPMKAMILLGVNAGLGNTDVSELRQQHLDLAGGWLNYPRRKTGVPRRVPLWAETVKALKAVADERPAAQDKADDDRVFVTVDGNAYSRTITKVKRDEATGREKFELVPVDSVGQQFGLLVRRLGIEQAGVGFYALRHVCRTIGGGAGDKEAIDSIMGHEDVGDMGTTHYVHGLDDDRLRRVTEHIRGWLFAEPGKPALKLTG